MALDIFIPYWGDIAYMKKAVNSVLAQDCDDWLLTVVDDAYPDDEVQRYVTAIGDRRINYIRKEVNQGITENFRSCVALATQDILVVMGCDDLLLPNFVNVVLASADREPAAWIIQPGVMVIDEAGKTVHPLADVIKQHLLKPKASGPRTVAGESLAVGLLHGDWLYWPSLAFRREMIRRFDFRDEFPVIQDLALILDMVIGGADVLIEPEVCFQYRRHTSSASSAKLLDGSRFVGERDYFKLAETLCAEKGWKKASRAARLRLTSRAHALLYLPLALRHRRTDTFRTLVIHALGR